MSTHSLTDGKHRPVPLSWLYWLASAVALGAVWIYHRIYQQMAAEKKPLSRSERKRLRKQMARAAMSRK